MGTNGNMTFVGDAPPNALYSIAEFTCNDGFEITEGEDYILACTTEGWSSEEPHCVPKSCEGETINADKHHEDISSNSNFYQIKYLWTFSALNIAVSLSIKSIPFHYL